MEGKFKDLITKIPKVNMPKINLAEVMPLIKRIIYYAKVWLLMTKNAFLMMLVNKKLFTMFLVGKVIRFILFTSFLFFLVKGAGSLAGYSINQTIFFFLTFNVIDILGQFLYREVYRFRPLVVRGRLDLILTKPMNVLFRVLMGGADIVDLVTLPPLFFAVIYVGRTLNPTALFSFYYLLLIVNGLLIVTAFHIAVLALGIVTLEIDHTIMIFRDLINMGRLPIEIYRQPLKGILTYLVPVGIMISLPAKALMGLVSPWGIISSFVFGVAALILATRLWKFALTNYTSASS